MNEPYPHLSDDDLEELILEWEEAGAQGRTPERNREILSAIVKGLSEKMADWGDAA
jgi:hypothetical protein